MGMKQLIPLSIGRLYTSTSICFASADPNPLFFKAHQVPGYAHKLPFELWAMWILLECRYGLLEYVCGLIKHLT